MFAKSARLLPSVLIFGFIIGSITQSCAPAPRHQLTSEEKTADLYWLYSQFGEYYAPLSYKQSRYSFDYASLKTKYLEDAKSTQNNEEFYGLMHHFVAEFKDAHTSSSLTASDLPARAQKAYLGFEAIRKGNYLVVTKMFPTVQSTSGYPVKVGDKISKLDGVLLSDVVQKEFLNYRNLGQPESSLSYHMPKIFDRLSLAQPMPTKANATLSIVRKDSADKDFEIELTVPWIVKDVVQFTHEQFEAAKKTPSKTTASLDNDLFFGTLFKGLTGEIDLLPAFIKKIAQNKPSYHYWDSFVFVDMSPTWGSKLLEQAVRAAAGQPESSLEELKKSRSLPDDVIFLNSSATYPTYLTNEKMVDKDDKATGKTKFVATMYLNTFSPATGEDEVVQEVRATLKTLKDFGVKDLIIDMINNGGGSLKLGLRLAQIMAKDKITMPGVQFKTSETWLDEFQNASMNGPSDAEREIARRVFVDLKESRAHGNTLSSIWSTDVMFPYSMVSNSDLDQDFNIVLLVNEHCASMCDIFSAVMKDNKLATIVGSKTMGAGGNVVAHFQAPNSHLIVNQTESLIVRKDGTYIENNGIEPDVAMAVNESSTSKYEPVRTKAIELFTKLKQ